MTKRVPLGLAAYRTELSARLSSDGVLISVLPYTPIWSCGNVSATIYMTFIFFPLNS